MPKGKGYPPKSKKEKMNKHTKELKALLKKKKGKKGGTVNFGKIKRNAK